MGTYKFQIISDDRFKKYLSPDIESNNAQQCSAVDKVLKNVPGIEYRILNPYPLTWPDGTKQIRTDVYIIKSSRQVTWNYIFSVINQVIPAPCYDRV